MRHSVLAVEISDPREAELPAVGHLTLVDPESGRPRPGQHLQARRARALRRTRARTSGDGRARATSPADRSRAAVHRGPTGYWRWGATWLMSLRLAAPFGWPRLPWFPSPSPPRSPPAGARGAMRSVSRRCRRCSSPRRAELVVAPRPRCARACRDRGARAGARATTRILRRFDQGRVDHACHRPLRIDGVDRCPADEAGCRRARRQRLHRQAARRGAPWSDRLFDLARRRAGARRQPQPSAGARPISTSCSACRPACRPSRSRSFRSLPRSARSTARSTERRSFRSGSSSWSPPRPRAPGLADPAGASRRSPLRPRAARRARGLHLLARHRSRASLRRAAPRRIRLGVRRVRSP